MATNMNIIYLDTTSGVVKTTHHAVFDEAWYLQDSRPPAAQLLYDLGLEADDSPTAHPASPTPPPAILPLPWPPMPNLTTAPKDFKWAPPSSSLRAHLPLRVSQTPPPLSACAARLRPSLSNPPKSKKQLASDVVTDFHIGHHDMELIYMSPDPYGKLFEECINLRKCNLTSHQTGGLQFLTKNNRLILCSMDPGTPGARIDKWRTRLRGA